MGHYVTHIQAYDGGPHAEYVKEWVEDPWDRYSKEELEQHAEDDRRHREKLKKEREDRDPTENMSYWEKHEYHAKKENERLKREFSGDKTDYVRREILDSFKTHAICFKLIDETHYRRPDGIEVQANFPLLKEEFEKMGYKVEMETEFIVHPHNQYWFLCEKKIKDLEKELAEATTENEKDKIEKDLKDVRDYQAKCY